VDAAEHGAYIVDSDRSVDAAQLVIEYGVQQAMETQGGYGVAAGR
jgi:hypothetical protein